MQEGNISKTAPTSKTVPTSKPVTNLGLPFDALP